MGLQQTNQDSHRADAVAVSGAAIFSTLASAAPTPSPPHSSAAIV